MPGHSRARTLLPEAFASTFRKKRLCLRGTWLFYRSVGAPTFPGGDADTLCRTLRERIYTLPSDTVVYPGHGPVTTVGDEAAHNPFCSI